MQKETGVGLTLYTKADSNRREPLPAKASEAALAGNPRWPPLTKRMRVAVSEAVALAQHAHESKDANFMPLFSGGAGQGLATRGDATQRYQRAQEKTSELVMGMGSGTLGACAALTARKKGAYFR